MMNTWLLPFERAIDASKNFKIRAIASDCGLREDFKTTSTSLLVLALLSEGQVKEILPEGYRFKTFSKLPMIVLITSCSMLSGINLVAFKLAGLL